jgi:hypothetical protein
LRSKTIGPTRIYDILNGPLAEKPVQVEAVVVACLRHQVNHLGPITGTITLTAAPMTNPSAISGLFQPV